MNDRQVSNGTKEHVNGRVWAKADVREQMIHY